MSETPKKEDTLEIPVMSITEEDLEKNRLAMQSAKDILTPPEGQVLAGLRSFCPIHGDITRASKIIKHTIYMQNEATKKVVPVSYSDVICLACLSELWRSKVVANFPKDEKGNPGEVKVAPVFISKEEYDKIIAEQEKAAEEAAKAAEDAATVEAAIEKKTDK